MGHSDCEVASRCFET